MSIIMPRSMPRGPNQMCWGLRTATSAQSFDRYGCACWSWFHVPPNASKLFSLPGDTISHVARDPVGRSHWLACTRCMIGDRWKNGRGITLVKFVNGRKGTREVGGAAKWGIVMDTRHLYVVFFRRGASRVCGGWGSKTRDGDELSGRGPCRDRCRGGGSVNGRTRAIGFGTGGWYRRYKAHGWSSVCVWTRCRTTWSGSWTTRGNGHRGRLRSKVLRRWTLYSSAKIPLNTTPLQLF